MLLSIFRALLFHRRRPNKLIPRAQLTSALRHRQQDSFIPSRAVSPQSIISRHEKEIPAGIPTPSAHSPLGEKYAQECERQLRFVEPNQTPLFFFFFFFSEIQKKRKITTQRHCGERRNIGLIFSRLSGVQISVSRANGKKARLFVSPNFGA